MTLDTLVERPTGSEIRNLAMNDPSGQPRRTGSNASNATTILPDVGTVDGEVVALQRDAERYERVAKLGEGGMGLVELARDNDIGRLVAVKRLKSSRDPERVLRFAREVRSLGRLEHPGIVPVHDVGRDEDDSYFLVMKHLEGETLETIIERLRAGDAAYHERYSLTERLRICEAVLRVMEYAHGRDVVHRDIKPANIMVGAHGEVTVLDWGLAKRVGDQPLGGAEDLPATSAETHEGVTLGTPAYMSPEQAIGHMDEVGQASDIYSMGVAFYELLCLRHYLAGLDHVDEVLRAVGEREAKLAYWYRTPQQDRIPIELAYWLQTAMQKRREDRFASVTEMRETLQRAVSGDFDVVCPTTLSRRVFRFGMDLANRRPLAMLLGAATVLACAGYGVFHALTAML